MPKKILLVEDEAIIALNESRIIENEGYEVRTVYSGEEAVDAVDAEPDITLILMDIDLGRGISGTEAARRILALHDRPIVFITSHAEKEYVERVKKITRYGYVLKNSGRFVLIEAITMAFELFDTHKKLQRENEERIKTEAKQEELALLYSHLMENSIDAVYLLNEVGKVLNVNRVATEMIGYTRSELLELTIDDIDLNYPSKNFIEFWRDKPGNTTLLFETIHQHKNGEIIPVEVNGIFFRLDGEKYLFGVARDIRERKKTEKLLRESEERYRRIFDNAPNLIMEVEAETYEILSCNPAMEKSLGITSGQVEGLKITDILPPEIFRKREAYGLKAFETKSIQRFVDERDGRYFQNIFIPIVENEHRTILTITSELTELFLSEQLYREKESNFRALAESAGVGITVIQDNNIVYINSTAIGLIGCSAEEAELVSMKFMIDRIHPDDRDFVAHTYRKQVESLSNTLESGILYPPIEYRHVKCDGSVVWVEARTSVITYDGKPVLLVIHNDLSKSKKAEAGFKINAERYRKAQRLGRVGNWEYNIQTTEFWGSEEAKRIYGFDPNAENFTTEDVESCISERDKVHQALVDLIEKGAEYDLEFEITTNDTKERKTIASVAELERDTDGAPLKVTGVIQDVSDRKRAESALRRSEKRRQNAQKLANTGHWDWYMEINELTWSEEVYEIFGQKPGSFSLSVESFESLIHPEDLDDFVAEREKALNEERDMDIEHRIIKPDGEIRYVHEIAEIVRNSEGAVEQVNGVVQDITERKKVEENLSLALEQKDFLFQELNHRTKNNLNMISSLVSLKNSEIECDLSDIKHQIDTIQIIYEKLSRRDLTSEIDVGDYLQELLEQIFYSYTNRGVLIENHIEGIHTGTRILVPLGLIVNEIATNAVKHGFTATEPPRFSIEMKETPGGDYTVNLSNNGNPFPEDLDIGNAETLGLLLISTLVKQLKGTLEVERRPSPLFTLRFPKDLD